MEPASRTYWNIPFLTVVVDVTHPGTNTMWYNNCTFGLEINESNIVSTLSSYLIREFSNMAT